MSQSEGSNLIKQALVKHGLDAVLAEVRRQWDELQVELQQERQQRPASSRSVSNAVDMER